MTLSMRLISEQTAEAAKAAKQKRLAHDFERNHKLAWSFYETGEFEDAAVCAGYAQDALENLKELK